MATTTENLQEAFAGESQANQKYKAFAKKAEKEGFTNIAKLFRTTAEAERIHAEGHLKALDIIASTAENLQAAIDGETHEFTEMYPPMVELAQADGHRAKTMFKFAVDAEEVHAQIYTKALEMIATTAENLQASIDGETHEFTEMYPPMVELAQADGHRAKTMFKFAVDAEEVHAQIYTKALEAVKAGVDLDVTEFHLCMVCGYIELGSAPEKCPVCGAKKKIFEQVV
jgi:rubrerythrin